MLLGFIFLAKYTNIWKVKYIYLSKKERKTFFFEKKTDFFLFCLLNTLQVY